MYLNENQQPDETMQDLDWNWEYEGQMEMFVADCCKFQVVARTVVSLNDLVCMYFLKVDLQRVRHLQAFVMSIL